MSLDEARLALGVLRRRAGDSPGAIRRETVGTVAVLWLDHPSAHGALSIGMMAALAEHVAALRAAPPTGLVLASVGRSFCAGGYLPEVRRYLASPADGGLMCRAMTTVLGALAELPCVTVAAWDGPAIGGGAELLTATDLRVCSGRARLRFAQGALGVSPGWGGAARLRRRVGLERSIRWLATSCDVSAAEAVEAGFASAADAPVDAALTWLGGCVADPTALAACVRAARASGAEVERAAFVSVWGGGAHRAALGLSAAPDAGA